MLRDFSEAEKARLIQEINNVDADHRLWLPLDSDAIEDERALARLQSHLIGLAAFHLRIAEAKDDSKKKADKIWASVRRVDADCAAALKGDREQLAELAGKLAALGQAMGPAGPDGRGPLLLRPLADMQGFLDGSLGGMDYERANDKWMQEQCDGLLRDEFSEDAWDNIGQPGSPFATKEQFLQALFDKTQKIMGTSANEVIDFNWTDPDANGKYNHDSGTVFIDGTKLHADEGNNTFFGIPMEPGDLVSTYDFARNIFHELRHAYQHETMDDPASHPFVSPETRAAWEGSSGANYIPYDRNNPEPYFDQPLEFDARSFAGQYDLGAKHLPPTDWLHWQQDYIDKGIWPP